MSRTKDLAKCLVAAVGVAFVGFVLLGVVAVSCGDDTTSNPEQVRERARETEWADVNFDLKWAREKYERCEKETVAQVQQELLVATGEVVGTVRWPREYWDAIEKKCGASSGLIEAKARQEALQAKEEAEVDAEEAARVAEVRRTGTPAEVAVTEKMAALDEAYEVLVAAENNDGTKAEIQKAQRAFDAAKAELTAAQAALKAEESARGVRSPDLVIPLH